MRGELEVQKKLMLIVCVMLNSFNVTLLIDNQSREQVVLTYYKCYSQLFNIHLPFNLLSL